MVGGKQNQIAASEVGDGSVATVEKLLKKLSSCTIKIICTDGNYAYNKHINIKHVITKAETCLVEAYNSILRHCLARLQRKTKSYSKSVEMLRLSVLLLVNKFNNRQRL